MTESLAAPTNLDPGDVLAFRYLCVFIFTPNNFLGYSHKLDRFYKSHRCRIGGQSRLQDLVRTIAPGKSVFSFFNLLTF